MSACKRSFNQVMTKKYCAAHDQDFITSFETAVSCKGSLDGATAKLDFFDLNRMLIIPLWDK